jgi:hypothetical protein
VTWIIGGEAAGATMQKHDAEWRKAWPARAKAYSRWQRGLKVRVTRWVLGVKLGLKVRERILRTWIYRWTYDNPRRVWAWARAARLWGTPIPMSPLISDQEWLARHKFPVTAVGQLSHYGLYCRPIMPYPSPLLGQQKAGKYTQKCMLEV